MRFGKIAICVLSAWLATVAQANDGVGGVGMGGILSLGTTDSVSMKSEILEIGWQKIHVTYEFENATDKDVTLPVVFPLPSYPADPGYSNMWAGQPRGFTLLVNGKSRAFNTHISADLCFEKNLACLNVTARLKEIGLTDEQIAYFPSASPFEDVPGKPFTVKKLSKTQTDLLAKEGLLALDADLPRGPLPLWKVSIVYSWQITFPARTVTKVEHEYAPFGSGGSPHSIWNPNDLDRMKDYCTDEGFKSAVSKEFAARVAKAKDKEEVAIPGTGIDYILTTANTWSNPIRTFTLRVKKSRASELVSFCFPGTPRKVDALTFETVLTDFSPYSELAILFMNTSDKSHDWSPFGINSEPPVLNVK